jgi:3-phosphoshikimate 1-carboxyvinyltransferase
MDTAKIAPVGHVLHASVDVPGSKSLTNRALAVAALAGGPTMLTNVLAADDTTRMAESLGRLGFSVTPGAGGAGTVGVEGLGGRIPVPGATLDVGNAGTTARFLVALVTLGSGDFVVDGSPRMRERPIAGLVDGLRQLGVAVECPTGCPPVRILAKGLPGGTVVVDGDTSSQFVSALLLVAPYARSPMEIVIGRQLSSKPYVDMTLAVMSDFGIEVARDHYGRFAVPGGRYRGRSIYRIESDASAASYFFAAAAIAGGTVRVERISRRSRQGDIAFLDVLSAMGCRVDEDGDGVQVTGAHELRGVDMDLADIPDTAQTLAVVAPFARSPTTVRGIASARLKECDRVAATCRELARLGVEVHERADGFVIQPCREMRGATVRTYDDHRMAMAFALVGLRVPGISIENPSCVTKTFPEYFDVLDRLRMPQIMRATERWETR